MRQHVLLNQHRLDTAEAISDEIEEYCEAVEKFNKDAKESPMSAAPAMEKRVPYNFGKGGRKSEGKIQKGLRHHPQSGEHRKFGGYCNWCWRISHKEAECWLKQEYVRNWRPSEQESKQRDIRECIQGRRNDPVKRKPKGQKQTMHM